MRKGENIRDEISFNGIDGLESPEFIQSVRNKAFSEDKAEDARYMAIFASLCFTGPALKWYEHLGDDMQTDWSLLRRALLARFPAGNDEVDNASQPLIFSGENPQECEDFVRSVRKHSHAEGKSHDDRWTAHYAGSCMAGDALKWHAKLASSSRDSWIKLERAILEYFPDPPPYAVAPAGRILIESWERAKGPSFVLKTEEAWLREARQKRAVYDETGPGGLSSVHWLLVEEGGKIPDTAIQTGEDIGGGSLLSIRTWYEGGLYPGKIGKHLPAPCVPYDGREIYVRKPYEVLVGDASAIRWVGNPWSPEEARNAPSIQMKSFHAVEGGITTDGSALLLVQAYRAGCGWQPGRMGPWWTECEIGWGSKIYNVPQARILVWAE